MLKVNNVFIGYGLDGVKYMFYDLVIKKLVRNCDVKYIEGRQLKDV